MVEPYNPDCFYNADSEPFPLRYCTLPRWKNKHIVFNYFQLQFIWRFIRNNINTIGTGRGAMPSGNDNERKRKFEDI